MFKHILVSATGYQDDAPAFDAALQMGKAFAAHLQFLHVRVDVTEILVAMSADGLGGGTVVQSSLDRMEGQETTQETLTWQSFAAFCANAGIPTGATAAHGGMSADMRVETGDEGGWLADHGRFSDMVVISGSRDGKPVPIDILEAALMRTNRPLLIAPPTMPADLFATVVIAWRDKPEALRAVAAASDIIARAARVIIVSVTEDKTADDDTPERLLADLRWTNPATEILRVDPAGGEPSDVLLATVREHGATLLVMGGYSRGRLSEFLFGGFTQRMLDGCDLPVLMTH